MRKKKEVESHLQNCCVSASKAHRWWLNENMNELKVTRSFVLKIS